MIIKSVTFVTIIICALSITGLFGSSIQIIGSVIGLFILGKLTHDAM